MTDPQLANLRDIHLPASIGWWPPAPGWWVLTVLILLLSAALWRWNARRRQAAEAKIQALTLIENCQINYQVTGDRPCAASEISVLLRRVALAYFPRKQVAGLQGDAWIDFLNSTGKNIDFNTVRDSLLLSPYQSNEATSGLDPLFSCACAWIKQRGTPCLN